MIKKAIQLLEGRLTNLKELPLHVFYLFEEPDLESEEAREMVSALDSKDRGTSSSHLSLLLVSVTTPLTLLLN